MGIGKARVDELDWYFPPMPMALHGAARLFDLPDTAAEVMEGELAWGACRHNHGCTAGPQLSQVLADDEGEDRDDG